MKIVLKTEILQEFPKNNWKIQMAKKRQIVRKSSYFLFVNIDFTLMKAFS
jgi:hypothetical protein